MNKKEHYKTNSQFVNLSNRIEQTHRTIKTNTLKVIFFSY
jgi:hypothetical protein